MRLFVWGEEGRKMGNEQSAEKVEWDCECEGPQVAAVSGLEGLAGLEGSACCVEGDQAMWVFGGGNEEEQSDLLVKVSPREGEGAGWAAEVVGAGGGGEGSPAARTGAAMGCLRDSEGRAVLVLFGGLSQQSQGGWLDDTHLFLPSTGSWRPLPCPCRPSPRDKPSLAVLSPSKLVLFGGWGPQQLLSDDQQSDEDASIDEEEDRGPCATFTWFDDLWLFDLETEEWRRVECGAHEGDESHLPSARAAGSLTAHRDGEGRPLLLLFGGRDPQGRTNQLHSLDPSSWLWRRLSPRGPLPTPRSFHAAASLGSRLLLWGGRDASEQPRDLDDLWVYDLSANAWARPSSSAPVPPRAFCACSPLPVAGHVLILGGSSEGRFYQQLLAVPVRPLVAAPPMAISAVDLLPNPPSADPASLVAFPDAQPSDFSF